MIYGIDIGSTTRAPDWSLLKEKGIEFAVIKATQGDYRLNPGLADLASGAKQAGLLVGLYHWCDPLIGAQAQADTFLRKTADLSFDFTALDFEQYWADWSEWPSRVKKLLGPQVISECGRLTAAALRAGSGDKKLLVYTRASFVHDYALPALNWLADYPLWIAHWAYQPGQETLQWEELFARPEHQSMQPALPRGISNWVLHQFSGDRFLLPGMAEQKADLNRFAGTLAELYQWFGLPAPQADPSIEQLERQVEQYAQLSSQVVRWLRAYIKLQKQSAAGKEQP